MEIRYGESPGETHERMEDRVAFASVAGKFLVLALKLDDEPCKGIWSWRQSMELAKNGRQS